MDRQIDSYINRYPDPQSDPFFGCLFFRSKKWMSAIHFLPVIFKFKNRMEGTQMVVLDPEFMFSTRQIRLLERLLCGMLFWYILFPLYAGQKSWHTYLTSG